MKISEFIHHRLAPAVVACALPVAILSLSTVPLAAYGLPAGANTSIAPVSLQAEAYVYPVMGPRVSSNFGMRKHPVYKSKRHHDGMDLAAPQGAAIRAITSGRVVYADPYAGYGNLVVVIHADGLTSRYGHCETIKVKPGQQVTAGQIIATVGSTGLSTGPHLHFEIRRYGVPEHPESILPGVADDSEG